MATAVPLSSVVTTEASVEASARIRREEPVVQPTPVATSAARAVAPIRAAAAQTKKRSFAAFPAK